MTENNSKDNATDHQVALANVLDKLNHTFYGLNTTMDKIQQHNNTQKHVQDKKIKILTFIAVAIVLVVVALASHIFYVIHTMEQVMTSMSMDMGEMRQYMHKMTASMENMTASMENMTHDMGTMTVKVTTMGDNVQHMSSNMQQVSSDLRQMSNDMQQISGDMRDMRKATVLIESSTRSMTRQVNQMSNTVSPVMDGARQFMPFVPWNNRYPRRR